MSISSIRVVTNARRTRLALLVAVALTLAGSSSVSAQDRSPEQLIAAGISARRAGNDEQALALFTQAWEAGHAPRARAQMGLAEQALGQFVEAEAHLAEAAAVSGDAWIVSHRAALADGLLAVRAHLGSLDVRADRPGVQLRVNGHDAGTLPLAQPLRLLPGAATVEVSAPGFVSNTRTVTVTAAQLSRESFELVPVPVAAVTVVQVVRPVQPARPVQPVQPVRHVAPRLALTTTRPAVTVTPPVTSTSADDTAESSSSLLPVLGWTAAGVGVVGVGLGIMFYTQRESAAASYNNDSLCLKGMSTREDNCHNYSAKVRSAESLMTVSLIGGGVFLAGGLALALLSGGSDASETPPTQARVSCTPTLGSVLGASCAGRF